MSHENYITFLSELRVAGFGVWNNRVIPYLQGNRCSREDVLPCAR